MTAFQQRLKAMIRAGGPVSVERFMTLAVGHYYATRDPFGTDGDFTTAPEISQMFGEMLGVFFADAWIKMGSPSPVLLVEAGPGRGTLMADLLRGTRHVAGFHQAVQIHLIEMSPVLMEKQKAALHGFDVIWHETLDTLANHPMLFVGNEFLDALPVRQYQLKDGRWHERMIGFQDDGFVFGLTPSISEFSPPTCAAGGGIKGGGLEAMRMPDSFAPAALPPPLSPLPQEGGGRLFGVLRGKFLEYSPARENFMRNLARRIRQHRGIALLIDYGHDRSGYGDTLQAVKSHRFVDVFADPGEADLTSHVDFAALKKAAQPHAAVYGPAGQGDFLRALGIDLRAARLGRADDAARLTADQQMGRLFRVMALCHDGAIELTGLPKSDA